MNSMTKLGSGRHFFGVTKVGERGQIVIPKEARSLFKMKSGDTLMVFGDESKGVVATVKADRLKDFGEIIMDVLGRIKEVKK